MGCFSMSRRAPARPNPPSRSNASMGFELENLGSWTEDFEFTVDGARTQAYAEATNDPTGAHRDGTLAPPNFAVVPIVETGAVAQATERVVKLLPGEEARRVHGEHDLVIYQPIRPGVVLRVRGATTGVFAKSTGTMVVARFDTADHTGELLNTQWMTTFYRGIASNESGGEGAPARPVSVEVAATPPMATITQRFDADQTYRYAQASGDHTPFHVDDAAARSAGLPGIIIHGLCTMAFATHGVLSAVSSGRPSVLRRIAVRFSAPALPQEEFTTKIWLSERRGAVSSFTFESSNCEGTRILTNGLAEIVES
jgi:acyl dehydratase